MPWILPLGVACSALAGSLCSSPALALFWPCTLSTTALRGLFLSVVDSERLGLFLIAAGFIGLAAVLAVAFSRVRKAIDEERVIQERLREPLR